MRTRYAGDEVFQQSQSVAAKLIQDQQRMQAVMERQRQRDVAAAYGEVLPFTMDDMSNVIMAKQRMAGEKLSGKKQKSRVNEAGNYTKPGLRKSIFNRIKAGSKGGKPGQWSARKAQMMAKEYKSKGGGYTN